MRHNRQLYKSAQTQSQRKRQFHTIFNAKVLLVIRADAESQKHEDTDDGNA